MLPILTFTTNNENESNDKKNKLLGFRDVIHFSELYGTTV
jgi:hypothetical protein